MMSIFDKMKQNQPPAQKTQTKPLDQIQWPDTFPVLPSDEDEEECNMGYDEPDFLNEDDYDNEDYNQDNEDESEQMPTTPPSPPKLAEMNFSLPNPADLRSRSAKVELRKQQKQAQENPFIPKRTITPDPDVSPNDVEFKGSETAAKFLAATKAEFNKGNPAEYTFYLGPDNDLSSVENFIKAIRQAVMRLRRSAMEAGITIQVFYVVLVAIEQRPSGYWSVTIARMSKEQYYLSRRLAETKAYREDEINYDNLF